MNVLTNRCVMDQRTLRGVYARVFRRTLMLFYCGAGLMAAAAVLLILLGGLSPLPFVLLLGAAAYLFLGVRQPGKQAKRQLQRYKQSGSGPAPQVTVWFGEEELTGQREGMEELVHIPYGSLKSILPNGDRIILWTTEKQYLALDTARFEHGTEADFWRLMTEKCILAVPAAKRST